MIRKIVCGCTVFVVSGVAAAQGAFDFDDIPGVDQQPAITVDINPMLVQILRTAIAGADPEAAAVLSGLRSIKLRVYSNRDNTRQFNSFIDDVTEELQDSGWLAVVSAQDEGSRIRWYMQMTEQEISGMTIMATDSAEAIFMNIDGSLSAEDLGRVMALPPVREALGQFRMPPPAAVTAPTSRPPNQ